MKIRLLNTALAALLLAGMAQAIASTDSSAGLTLSGAITPLVTGCEISLSKQLVYLEGNVSRLPHQGTNAINPSSITAYITGKDMEGAGSLECSEAVKAGQIALKFTGTADNVEGTVLANSYTESNAAKGVGIGVFGPGNYPPVAINSGLLQYLTPLPDLRGAIQFNVELVKLTGKEVTPGNVAGALTIQIERL
ncbi:fimbrial protein [Cronobacter turicensis]